MTSTNATSFAPTFTYRASAPAISENPMSIAVGWHRLPRKRRRMPFTALSTMCSDLGEAMISASVSWMASLIIMGLVQCATTLTAHHAILSGLKHVAKVFQ